MNRRKVGAKWEDAACAFLTSKGVRILARNFKSYRNGEIDIVGSDTDGSLLFIEVKYRKDDTAGSPGAAVTGAKQRSICRTSDFYRRRFGIGEDVRMRYDVVCFSGTGEVSWIKNAFDYIV